MNSDSQLRHEPSFASITTNHNSDNPSSSTKELIWPSPVGLKRSPRMADLRLGQEDEEKDSSEDGSLQVSYSSKCRRALLRKVDARLLPLLFSVYVLCFLDRTNIANARSEGLETDLRISGLQYNTAFAIFYIFYFIIEVPSNIILTQISPRIWFTIITVSYGFIMTMQGLSKLYPGLLASRSFLGLAEGGLFPGVAWYFTTWYPRYETGFRIAIFFSAAPFAGAIGGFLATGISLMNGIEGLHAWSWIFIVEGLATIVLGVFSYFFLVDNPATAKFITSEEKLELQRQLATDPEPDSPHYFKWKHVLQAFRDFKIYANMLQTLGVYTCLYSISLFLPTILKELGYPTIKSQLLSIPVYLLAFVLTLTGSFAADKCRQRGVFMLGFEALAIVGLLMLRMSEDLNVQYAGTFFAAGGIYPLVPLLGAWNSNNLTRSTKRAVGIGMQIGFGNLGGVIAAFIYLNKDAPRFVLGHMILLSLISLSTATTAFMTYWLRRENARRARVLSEQNFTVEMLKKEEREKGDKATTFVYTV